MAGLDAPTRHDRCIQWILTFVRMTDCVRMGIALGWRQKG
jgi:hypothetical protein